MAATSGGVGLVVGLVAGTIQPFEDEEKNNMDISEDKSIGLLMGKWLNYILTASVYYQWSKN